MKRTEKVLEWMMRARSNLARAKMGKVSPDIIYEDLCFDAQQAVEKSLKALCIFNEILFPKTHDISYLMELLENNGVKIPKGLQKAKILTSYAVETRYPGDYGFIEESKYLESLDLAEKVLTWVESMIQ